MCTCGNYEYRPHVCRYWKKPEEGTEVAGVLSTGNCVFSETAALR